MSRRSKRESDSGRSKEIAKVVTEAGDDGLAVPADSPTPSEDVPVFCLTDSIPVTDEDGDPVWPEETIDVVFYSLRDQVSFAEAEEQELLHREDGPAVMLDNGVEEWFYLGLLHREDGPARISCDPDRGLSETWYRHGIIHREDGPAITFEDGLQEWVQNGDFERGNDLPALVKADGSQFWFKDGVYHRDGDLPAIIRADGTLEWCRHGLLHRDNGSPAFVSASGKGVGWWVNGVKQGPGNDQPACIHSDGTKEWFEDGKLHRLGAPAVQGPGRWCWSFHGQEHRPGGLPTNCWNLGDRRVIGWCRAGLDGNSVDVADLAIPDYGEPACLTVFSTGPGEIGSYFTTRKGIGFALVALGLELDADQARELNGLRLVMLDAKCFREEFPTMDLWDLAYASEDRDECTCDPEDFKRVYSLR